MTSDQGNQPGSVDTSGVGQPGFVDRHGLRDTAAAEQANQVIEQIRELGLRTVRMIVVDQHGAPRSKFLSADAAIAAMGNGLDFSGAIYSLDTGNQMFTTAFADGGGFGIPELTGFPDVVLVPDPSTFKVLPWADRTGWMICDAYFSTGARMPLDTRGILRHQLGELGSDGYGYLAGLEVEFYITRATPGPVDFGDAGFTPPPPRVSVFERGYQYLSEVRLDSVSDTLQALRDALWEVGLPPRTMEDEWGPGQMEFTFSPLPGLAAADAMILLRTTIKEACQRRGLLATFMCRPGLDNAFSSGWHLHESLTRGDQDNVFADPDEAISPVGKSFVAGLLEHAIPTMPFAAPTVTGYKRYRSYSFAPDRVTWALENRGAMIRVQGGPGDRSSHVENRLGEPAANPYLYMAANIAAGLDGIRRNLDPPPALTSDPYTAHAPMLPTSLDAAVTALDQDGFYRKTFGDSLVDYLVMMKRAEYARYQDAIRATGLESPDTVTDWEMREYFEFF